MVVEHVPCPRVAQKLRASHLVPELLALDHKAAAAAAAIAAATSSDRTASESAEQEAYRVECQRLYDDTQNGFLTCDKNAKPIYAFVSKLLGGGLFFPV